MINADQPADGFVADIEEDGSNVRPSIDSIVGLAEGDRCMLEKNVLLHGEGVPCSSGSIEKTSIPSHQSILPPKSQAALVKPVPPHQRSTSEKRKCPTRRATSATLARSVSPTIGKALNNASQPKLQVCLQAQVRSKKRLSGKGRLHQRLDIDVSQPVGVPVPPDHDMSPREPIQSSVGQNIVDLEALISTEETKRDICMKEQISDSVGKWCGSLNFSHQQRIAHVALKVLRRVESTICLIAAAYRLLARAPWTKKMIATDIKQAALYAVSKGWHLKMPYIRDVPFSKADFAVAAATYLEQVPPNVPEDPFKVCLVIIDFLPLICGSLFSQAVLSCQWCKASCTVPIPCFITNTTWTMDGWDDFATTISQSKLHPWIQRHGWHNGGCDMTCNDISLGRFGPWIYLQLQTERHEDLPLVCQSMQIPRDGGLHLLEAAVTSLLCTNDTVSIGGSRHYWVAEVDNFAITSIYDAVDGKQKLTKA